MHKLSTFFIHTHTLYCYENICGRTRPQNLFMTMTHAVHVSQPCGRQVAVRPQFRLGPGSSRTEKQNCSLGQVYIVQFFSFGSKLKIGQNDLRGHMALEVKISSKGHRRLKFGHKVHFGVYQHPKKTWGPNLILRVFFGCIQLR